MSNVASSPAVKSPSWDLQLRKDGACCKESWEVEDIVFAVIYHNAGGLLVYYSNSAIGSPYTQGYRIAEPVISKICLAFRYNVVWKLKPRRTDWINMLLAFVVSRSERKSVQPCCRVETIQPDMSLFPGSSTLCRQSKNSIVTLRQCWTGCRWVAPGQPSRSAAPYCHTPTES